VVADKTPGDHRNQLLRSYFFFFAAFLVFFAAFFAFFFVAMVYSFRLWLMKKGLMPPVLHLQSRKTGTVSAFHDFVENGIHQIVKRAAALRGFFDARAENEMMREEGGSKGIRQLWVTVRCCSACRTSQSIQGIASPLSCGLVFVTRVVRCDLNYQRDA